MPADSSLVARLRALPSLSLAQTPTPVEELARLRDALGGGPRILVKRDDAVAFAFGGNKVRKMRLVAARAIAEGADTLITCGGVQSNHARVTASIAARMGLRCVLVVNGEPPARPTANALLDRLTGADVRYVASRDERAPAMDAIAAELRHSGGRPFIVPLGASTPLGAAAYVQAIGELLDQSPAPDVIVHATSSGGTQAGLVAGCRLHGLATRVVGISADDPAGALTARIAELLQGVESLLGAPAGALRGDIDVDDSFVGEGYGIPTAASDEALRLCASTEALFLDPTYTAKAMAGLIARVRARAVGEHQTIVFWHTGGQVGLFA
ncbi:MAG TPA: D-cysteine desulfhydrase family protein [Vicinamibacterales bacterium]|nr:D-cysteine desulfhydrase family protein [Vicinamibacterales bacterium]